MLLKSRSRTKQVHAAGRISSSNRVRYCIEACATTNGQCRRSKPNKDLQPNAQNVLWAANLLHPHPPLCCFCFFMVDCPSFPTGYWSFFPSSHIIRRTLSKRNPRRKTMALATSAAWGRRTCLANQMQASIIKISIMRMMAIRQSSLAVP